jgi:hypothetical protein
MDWPLAGGWVLKQKDRGSHGNLFPGVFSRHYRIVKVIFGLIDVILTSLAFVLAYETRARLHFQHAFYLDFPVALLLLILSVLCWIGIGYWLNVYEKLDSARPRVVLRDTFRQCALGAVCMVVAKYTLRLEPYELSRPFVALFALYAWVFLCLFRTNAARVIGTVRRQFGTAHFVMVVGSGEAVRRLGEALEKSSDYGVRLIGFLAEEQGHVESWRATYEQYPLSRLRECCSVTSLTRSSSLWKADDWPKWRRSSCYATKKEFGREW